MTDGQSKETTDTFTDARGRHYIAGQYVPDVVWGEFEAVRALLAKLDTNLRFGKLYNEVVEKLTQAEQQLKDLRSALHSNPGWLDPPPMNEPEGFHSSHGWWFKRAENGDVLLTHVSTVTNVVDTALVFNPATWASIVTEVSATPGPETYELARKLHEALSPIDPPLAQQPGELHAD